MQPFFTPLCRFKCFILAINLLLFKLENSIYLLRLKRWPNFSFAFNFTEFSSPLYYHYSDIRNFPRLFQFSSFRGKFASSSPEKVLLLVTVFNNFPDISLISKFFSQFLAEFSFDLTNRITHKPINCSFTLLWLVLLNIFFFFFFFLLLFVFVFLCLGIELEFLKLRSNDLFFLDLIWNYWFWSMTIRTTMCLTGPW